MNFPDMPDVTTEGFPDFPKFTTAAPATTGFLSNLDLQTTFAPTPFPDIPFPQTTELPFMGGDFTTAPDVAYFQCASGFVQEIQEIYVSIYKNL